MAVERGFARVRREKNEGAQVKRREGAMLSEIEFNGGTTITCAPEFNVSLNYEPTSHS
jgi:hypothetical protein